MTLLPSAIAHLRTSATALLAGVALYAAPAAGATLVAQYGFEHSLSSGVTGAPDLFLVDPRGTSGFVTDTVFGSSRTVLEFNGSKGSVFQGGLRFDSTGLLTPDSYSVALTFQFLDFADSWRRIIDTSNRTQDAGFYVGRDNMLTIYPDSGSDIPFANNEYRNVVLTVSPGGAVSAYIDGGASFSTNTSGLDISSTGMINLFLDDLTRPQEWAPGRIAALSFYNGVLTPDEVAIINQRPFDALPVPEPATWAMLIAGFGFVGLAARRRNPATVTN